MADNTLEQMLENLINDNQETAENLFHEYVVAKSREIYETLIETELSDDEDKDDEKVDEVADEDKDDEKVDEESDEDKDEDEKVDENFDQFAPEAEEEPAGEFGGDPTDELEAELDDAPGEEGADEFEKDLEDKEPVELFQDLDAIVDELQAKFDVIAGVDGEEGEMEPDGDEGENPFADSDGDGDEEIEDSFEQELATVREYVEKIGAPKMGDNGVNNKSIVAGKNDMGGTSANITKGGESKGEGTKGGLADITPKEDNAGNINVPGGKAGKSAFKKKESGHGAEKKGAGEDAENKQSLFRGKRK